MAVKTRMSGSDNPLGDDECVAIDVADTGIGIPQDVLLRKFERIGATVRAEAGLGLAITRRIARLLGAEVAISTTRGAGPVFTPWLRAAAE